MHEIELRFHVLKADVERVRRHVDPRGTAAQTPLAAIYFDTADRALARAGIGIRLRREGRVWVQSCKGPAEDGITRLEHNARLTGRGTPTLDLARHADHPLGEHIAALQAAGIGPLLPTFRTAIRRTHRVQRLRGAQVELAWDAGALHAGEAATARQLPVHEMEMELVTGQAGALLAHAHGLVARLPLALDLRSKAERGERLAHGQLASPARKAQPTALTAAMQPGEALRAVLLGTFHQVARNASQIATGTSSADHVHQLRVGLRRLRSGLRLFRGLWPELAHPALPAFEAQAAALFRRLGAVRDADVLADGLSPALATALRDALPEAVPAPPPAPGAAGGAQAAMVCVREPSAQQFLIEWLGWLDVLARNPVLMPVPAPTDALQPDRARLAPVLRRRLRRWQAQLQTACARFAELNVEERHDLRKRFKRLRYATDLCAALFKPKELARAIKPIVRAQAVLGELNDLELALAASRARLAVDPQAYFEVGWLAAQRSTVLARCLPVMAALAQAPRLRKG